MTITSSTQVYGFRVTRNKFYKWALENHNPHDRIYSTILLNLDQEDLKLEDFKKYLHGDKENEDAFQEFETDLIYQFNENKHDLYRITHDHDTDDIVFGVVVAKTEYKYPPNSMDPETDVEFDFDGSDIIDEINNICKKYPKLFMDMDPEVYLIQNDCSCCS